MELRAVGFVGGGWDQLRGHRSCRPAGGRCRRRAAPAPGLGRGCSRGSRRRDSGFDGGLPVSVRIASPSNDPILISPASRGRRSTCHGGTGGRRRGAARAARAPAGGVMTRSNSSLSVSVRRPSSLTASFMASKIARRAALSIRQVRRRAGLGRGHGHRTSAMARDVPGSSAPGSARSHSSPARASAPSSRSRSCCIRWNVSRLLLRGDVEQVRNLEAQQPADVQRGAEGTCVWRP